MLLGAIWSPCSGPTLGAAIALAAQSETAGRAATVMAMFSLGAATPILALAYGSRQAIVARHDLLARTSRIAKPRLATFNELTFSVLLIVGLATRIATVPLLGMIAVIQTFVYPQAWTEHLLWASILVFLLTRGPGELSLDYLIERWALKQERLPI